MAYDPRFTNTTYNWMPAGLVYPSHKPNLYGRT